MKDLQFMDAASLYTYDISEHLTNILMEYNGKKLNDDDLDIIKTKMNGFILSKANTPIPNNGHLFFRQVGRNFSNGNVIYSLGVAHSNIHEVELANIEYEITETDDCNEICERTLLETFYGDKTNSTKNYDTNRIFISQDEYNEKLMLEYEHQMYNNFSGFEEEYLSKESSNFLSGYQIKILKSVCNSLYKEILISYTKFINVINKFSREGYNIERIKYHNVILNQTHARNLFMDTINKLFNFHCGRCHLTISKGGDLYLSVNKHDEKEMAKKIISGDDSEQVQIIKIENFIIQDEYEKMTPVEKLLYLTHDSLNEKKLFHSTTDEIKVTLPLSQLLRFMRKFDGITYDIDKNMLRE